MRNMVFLRVLLFAGLASVLASILPTAARAELTTWVSGTGDDNNSTSGCQVTAPCRSLVTAISETNAGGTVFCAGSVGSAALGSTLSIAQDVTIDCSQGTLALPALCEGGNGITINTGGIKVTLRGLTIYSVDPPGCFAGGIGVNITAAASVRIENCKIFGFSSPGVEVAPSSGLAVVTIQDSTITQDGGGVLLKPQAGGSIKATFDHVAISGSAGGGIKVDSAGGPVNLDITDSEISNNAGNGINLVGSNNTNMLNLSRTVIAKNGVAGLQTNGGTTAALVDTTLFDTNANGATAVVGSGHILTYGNNRIVGGAGSGFTGTASLQ